MKRQVTKRQLDRLVKARAKVKEEQEKLEAAQREHDAEVDAARRRAEQAELKDERKFRKERTRELIRVGGIAAKAGLTGLEKHVLEELFLDSRERLDCGERSGRAVAALIEQAGLGKESLDVVFGILLRGKEKLEEGVRREAFARKGREKLQELEAPRKRDTRQAPIPADRVDRPPLKVRFNDRPSEELRTAIKKLGMTYFSDEQAWRGPNKIAIEVRAAIKATGNSHLVLYPADWRDL